MTDLDNQSSEETEQAQLSTLLRDTQALAEMRRRLALQQSRPSLEECADCGETIPEARRQAVPGVQMCIYCQSKQERFKANYRLPDDYIE